MTTGSTGTKRRTFFQRGLALLAGGAGLAGASRLVAAAAPPAVDPGNTLRLFARSRAVDNHQHSKDGRILATGDLLDGPDGERIGTYYTNCFCVPTAFGVQVSAPSTLEFHVLQLQDGTLFTMGSGRDSGGHRQLAIIGGTERFAGRSGVYMQHPVAGNVAAVTITFAV